MKQPSIFLSVLVAALIIIVGYHKIFWGHNFFDHEDWIAISGHSAGNKFSNGWRADKGIGLSYFYGDPGLWHPWSLLSFWERVMPNRTLAWTLSVIGLDFGIVLAWLLFIFRFFPSINRWLAVLIVPLMVFCFDAPASHYARSWISIAGAIPLQFWVLFHYYKNPRWGACPWGFTGLVGCRLYREPVVSDPVIDAWFCLFLDLRPPFEDVLEDST